jgi:acyl carrier protein
MVELIRNEVQQVFRDVFGDPQLVLRDDMTANDVEGWDSLQHLNLVIAMEKRLGIKFATAEISRLKEDGQNIGTLLEMVKRKRG